MVFDMKKQLIALILAGTVLSATACASNGTAGQTSEESASATTTAEETTENTALDTIGETTAETGASDTKASDETGETAAASLKDFTGTFYSGRIEITVEAGEDDNAKIRVEWAGGFKDKAEWTMSGKFDPVSKSISYSDCVKKEVTYKSENEIESSKEIYTGGKGSFFFDNTGKKLIWKDDKENTGEGLNFEQLSETEAKG